MEEYLEDLSNELKIKTSALKTAEEYIEVLQENLQEMSLKLKKVTEKYGESLSIISNLESELDYLKSPGRKEDTGKKSITKTVITDRNVPNQAETEPLKMISGHIFNEFTQSYYSLIDQLSTWVEKETDEQHEQGFLPRL